MAHGIASRRAIVSLVALALALLVPVVPVQVAHAANTLMVSTTGTDNGDCRIAACLTIGYALIQASPSGGDTITVAANTAAMPTYQEFDSIVVDRNITLTGAGAAATIIDGTRHIQSLVIVNAGISATITGFTFQNGNANAGAIDNRGMLTLTSSVIANNKAYYGGAGIGNIGQMNVIDCAITNNSSSNGQGGGILNYGALSMTNTTISGNDATAGGGIANGPPTPTTAPGSILTVTNSTIRSNRGPYRGAEILNNKGMVTLADTTIGGGASFGGIYNGDQMSIARSLITGSNGGIVGENSYATLSMTNSTVSGTSAGIASEGYLTLTNVTVTANAHGVFATLGWSAVITDSIIAGNTRVSTPDVSGAFTSGGHNLIGIADGSTGFTGPGDLTGTTASPLDAKLGSLASNGGPTQTHALLNGSPAYNAGGATCPAGIVTDQRGISRPQGPACDIGAFEVQISALPPPRPPGQIVGSPTVLPPPRPTAVPPGGPPVSTPNPLPPHR